MFATDSQAGLNQTFNQGLNQASNLGKNSEFSSVNNSTGERTFRLCDELTSAPQEKQKLAPTGKSDWHWIQVFKRDILRSG